MIPPLQGPRPNPATLDTLSNNCEPQMNVHPVKVIFVLKSARPRRRPLLNPYHEVNPRYTGQHPSQAVSRRHQSLCPGKRGLKSRRHDDDASASAVSLSSPVTCIVRLDVRGKSDILWHTDRWFRSHALVTQLTALGQPCESSTISRGKSVHSCPGQCHFMALALRSLPVTTFRAVHTIVYIRSLPFSCTDLTPSL